MFVVQTLGRAQLGSILKVFWRPLPPLRSEPGMAGREVGSLPLCYAPSSSNELYHVLTKSDLKFLIYSVRLAKLNVLLSRVKLRSYTKYLLLLKYPTCFRSLKPSWRLYFPRWEKLSSWPPEESSLVVKSTCKYCTVDTR